MKKRLRRKLGKGEYAHPYALTRKQREANSQMRWVVLGMIKEIGEERFMDMLNQATDRLKTPNTLQPWCARCSATEAQVNAPGFRCQLCEDEFGLPYLSPTA